MLTIIAIRTGRIYSFSAVEFNILLPDGSVLTNVWSAPWSELDYDDPAQDAGAIEYGKRVYAQRQLDHASVLNAHILKQLYIG